MGTNGETDIMPLRTRRFHSESGMTMIELLIAGVVLVFGMLSLMGLLALAIGNNGRSKVDSSATMLTQVVVEQISAVLAGGGPGSIKDCSGTVWTIGSSAGSPPGGWGAQLLGDGIDFSQSSPPASSHMDYVVCTGNTQSTYDVRWNVQNLTSGGTYLVTVAARPKASPPVRFAFALPVKMRAYVGR
jgi:type II secretory pathway pseudopilin PulG